MPDVVEISYETRDWTPDSSVRLTASLYEGYALQTIHIPGAAAASDQARAVGRHGRGRPSPPLLPAAFAAAAATAGILSDAQL